MGRNCKFWSECKKLSEARIRNSGLCLCREHFAKSVEDRMERAVSHYRMQTAPYGVQEHWALSCTGSDHSLALVAALSRRFHASSPRLKITVVHVNVGLSAGDYSRTVEEKVRAVCDKCAMPCVVVSLAAELGVSADAVHAAAAAQALDRSAAHAVRELSDGLLRQTAHKLGAHKIAACDSLNDAAADLLTRWCSMDVARIAQPQPWSDDAHHNSASGSDGSGSAEVGWSIPKVCPFVEISDDELDFYFARCTDIGALAFRCPYYAGAFVAPLQQHLESIERERAGTMLRMVRGFDSAILPIVRPEFLAQQRAGTLRGVGADPALDIIRANHAKRDAAPGTTARDREDDEDAARARLDAVAVHACARCGTTVVATQAHCACCALVAALAAGPAREPVAVAVEPREDAAAQAAAVTLEIMNNTPTAAGEGSRKRKREAWKRRQEAAAAAAAGKEAAQEPETKKACTEHQVPATEAQ